MKILHTADLHLGKKLMGRSRLNEQRALMDEIVTIAKDEKVTVVLVAGDVFDTFLPPAEAEELFYETLSKLAKFSLPVVLPGNHDDALRLSAPTAIAKTNGIVLVGDDLTSYNFTHNGISVKGEQSSLKINANGEVLNLALLPFPTQGKLLSLAGEVEFSQYVSEKTVQACSNFTKGEINIFMSHLFVLGAESSDERELGGSKIIPPKTLKIENCSYVALGHIHKPLAVSKADNIYYSGSMMNTTFDDLTEKRVIIVDSDGKSTEVKSVPLTSGRKLKKITVESEQEAISALDENSDCLVLIEYRSSVPLLSSAIAEMKKRECFCGIEVVQLEREKEATASRKSKTDSELFEMFYERKTGNAPKSEITELFLKAVGGEEL